MEFFQAFLKYGLGPIIALIITIKIFSLKIHTVNKLLGVLLTLIVFSMFLPTRTKLSDSHLYSLIDLTILTKDKYFAVSIVSYILTATLYIISRGKRGKLQLLSFVIFLVGITSIWISQFSNPDYTEARHTPDKYGAVAPLTGYLWVTSDAILPTFILLLYLFLLSSEKDRREATKYLRANLKQREYKN